jgi:hypothetical protein
MSDDGATFLTRDVLLAVGFTLLVVGVFLRGFARSTRRGLALRRQHELHVRSPGSPSRAADEAIRTTHLERNVGRYAVVCVVLALLVISAAFLRR